MRLSELFEDGKEKKFLQFWASVEGAYRKRYTGQEMSRIQSLAKTAYMDGRDVEPQDAIGLAREIVQGERDDLERKASTKTQQPKQSQAKPARDRVKPTITTPSGDRTRQDALGRNLKADRYYNQLNKSERGRNIIKKVSQKLGLPPESDKVIDHIADTMPSVIQKLDTILANPANIGGRLNPRNRRG